MRTQRPAGNYLVHGLRVSSELHLDAAEAELEVHDLAIRIGEPRPIPDAPADGRLLARLDLPTGTSSLAAGSDHYTMRIHGHCDFEISEAHDFICVHESPELDDRFAALMAGSVLAVVLNLRGASVVHASAVEVDGGAVAFMAGVGMGKTTTAALCCAAGARLVTDDVLRLEVADGRGWCFRGSGELRLRAPAAYLAAPVSRSPARPTLDKRHAVRPETTVCPRLPIRAIVATRFDPQADQLRVARVRGVQAIRELVSFPRTLGWTNIDAAQRDFGVLAELARFVPLYRATLPQSPDVAIGQALLAALDL